MHFFTTNENEFARTPKINVPDKVIGRNKIGSDIIFRNNTPRKVQLTKITMYKVGKNNYTNNFIL